MKAALACAAVTLGIMSAACTQPSNTGGITSGTTINPAQPQDVGNGMPRPVPQGNLGTTTLPAQGGMGNAPAK